MCGAHTDCINKVGATSPSCTCQKGYQLPASGSINAGAACILIDECSQCGANTGMFIIRCLIFDCEILFFLIFLIFFVSGHKIECVTHITSTKPSCTCKPGFTGDPSVSPYECTAVTFRCAATPPSVANAVAATGCSTNPGSSCKYVIY